MINPAPGFWPMFDSLAPTAGPGSPGNGPGSKNSAGCAKNQPRRPILSFCVFRFDRVAGSQSPSRVAGRSRVARSAWPHVLKLDT